MTLQGWNEFWDWKAQDNISKGRNFLKSHSFSSINHVNRSGNFCAYKLAYWARQVDSHGRLDIITILPEVLNDGGGTFVTIDDDDLNDA